MSGDGEKAIAELADAASRFAFREVAAIVDRLGAADLDEAQAIRASEILRKRRFFGELEKACGLFLALGHTTPEITTLYAQALIDQRRVDDGICVLRALLRTVQGHAREPGVRGLLGRALKQRFVLAGAAADLQAAIEAYRWGWERRAGDYRWTGINLVALLERGHRDAIPVAPDLHARAIAGTIRAEIDALAKRAVWDDATALEASIALGDRGETMRWLEVYATSARGDDFALAGTSRQLIEIWKLEGTPLGRVVLPVLDYERAHSEGSLVTPSTAAIDEPAFQAIYGKDGPVKLAWIRKMLALSGSIARVQSDVGDVHGTGFLARGDELRADWGAAPVFVTSAHVVSDDPDDAAPLRIGRAHAAFTEIPDRPVVKLGDCLFTSPKRVLDVSVFRVEPPPRSVVVERAGGNPVGDRTQRIYVIGHGGGEDLSVSLYNNEIAGYEDPYVRYRSPTKKGHSGSPVLNAQLDWFAIHHAARPHLSLNEGVMLDAVRAKLAV